MIAVCAAMTSGLEEEIAYIGITNANFSRAYEEHAKVMAGQPVVHWRWYHGLWPGHWFRCCYGEEFHSEDARTIMLLRDGGVGSTSVTHPVHLPPNHNFLPVYNPKTTTMPAQDGSARLMIGPDNMKHPIPPSCILSLICLGPFIPTTARNDLEAFTTGWKVRIARAVPEPEDGAWEFYTRLTHDPRCVLHKLRLPIMVVNQDGLNAWLLRFPEAMRDVYMAALRELETRDLRDDDLRGGAMVKAEKQGFCAPIGPPDLDPRLVIAYKPIRQVCTGPWDWHAAKYYREVFNVKSDSPAVWVNGRDATAEAFGRWYDHALASVVNEPSHKIYYGDHSKFEAHRSEGAFDYAKDLMFAGISNARYRRCREGSWVLKGRAQRHNVRYEVEFKLGSGGTETSIDSFQRNLTGLVHVFGEPNPGRTYFAVNGDDWLVITTSVMEETTFHERMLELGFESSFVEARSSWDVEFCQTVPYPCGGHTVWGPKIGRVLSRLPFSLKGNKLDPVGIALGMQTSCHHIPFLSDYLNHILRLSPETTPIKYDHHIASEYEHDSDESTWAFVQHRYGLTPQDLQDFNAIMSEVDSLGSMTRWEWLEALIKTDE